MPEHVREYLRGLGFLLPLENMEGYIREWHEWMSASGSFYDYRDTDGFGRVYEVHRRSIHPAMRVCTEWSSLLLNDKTQVVCESQECTDWLEGEVSSDNSALMRNIARHEHSLETSIAGISRALLHCARTFGEGLPDEGVITCVFDDSIITDVAAEKRISMAEVGVTMHPWEYRMRYYGEDESTAKKRAEGLGVEFSGK